MLWFALHYPLLAIDCIERRMPDAIRPALAVVQNEGPRRVVAMANHAARTQGVNAQQTLATALALCPELLVIERDLIQEQQIIREAALATLRYTPNVSLRSSGVLLELAASVRLFGGKSSLLAAIRQTCRTLGLTTSIGIAPNSQAAWLLAHAAPSGGMRTCRSDTLAATLDTQALHFFEAATPHLAIFEGIGCATLGALRRLPRSGLVRRFGSALINALDSTYGKHPEAHCWFSAPAHFSTRIELMARADNTASLHGVIEHLLVQLAGWLTARHCAVGVLTLTLYHEAWQRKGAHSTPLQLRLAQASNDARYLFGLLRERLARLVLDAPVEALGLSADDYCQSTMPSYDLFPGPHNNAITLNHLCEKISARLGPLALRQIHSVADHRPEKSWNSSPYDAQTPHPAATRSDTARPSWLMAIPEALSVHGHRPVYGSELTLLSGPERIESGWWDDAPIARDYYIAENTLGQLLWIFCERQHQPGNAAWYLHGLFA